MCHLENDTLSSLHDRIAKKLRISHVTDISSVKYVWNERLFDLQDGKQCLNRLGWSFHLPYKDEDWDCFIERAESAVESEITIEVSQPST